jgi:hypothetical protein
MANHGPVYGLDADLEKKRAAGYNKNLEQQAQRWIEAVVGEKFPSDFHTSLKDGLILCKLANKLKPGSVPQVGTQKAPFIQMENIGRFLKAVSAYGLPATDQFMTVDLFEAKNMNQVVQCVHALGRLVKKNGFSGPQLETEVAKSQVDPYN